MTFKHLSEIGLTILNSCWKSKIFRSALSVEFRPTPEHDALMQLRCSVMSQKTVLPGYSPIYISEVVLPTVKSAPPPQVVGIPGPFCVSDRPRWDDEWPTPS